MHQPDLQTVISSLLELDLDFARRLASTHADGARLSDEQLLEVLHKVRYERAELPLQARRESAAWLLVRQRGDMRGGPVGVPGSATLPGSDAVH